MSAYISYNTVYRASVAGGPYTLVATLQRTQAYTDRGLTIGNDYSYVVTAVNSAGQESVHSSEASSKPGTR